MKKLCAEYRVKGPYAEEKELHGTTLIRVSVDVEKDMPAHLRKQFLLETALERLQPLYDKLDEPVSLTVGDLEIARRELVMV